MIFDVLRDARVGIHFFGKNVFVDDPEIRWTGNEMIGNAVFGLWTREMNARFRARVDYWLGHRRFGGLSKYSCNKNCILLK